MVTRVAFPIVTFADMEGLGLQLQVWCLGCKRYAEVDLSGSLAHRLFAGARFRCRRCGSVGAPSLAPVERLPPGSAVLHADVFCQRCVPSWEVREVRFDKPPWSALDVRRQRYACPGCGALVDWIWYGRSGMPFTNAFRRG